MEKALKSRVEIERIKKAVEDNLSSQKFKVNQSLMHQELLDFLNENKLGDQFVMSGIQAKKHFGKDMLLRVRPEKDRIIYECFDLETGDVLDTMRCVRGQNSDPEYEFCCFTLNDVTVKVEIGLKPGSFNDPEKIIDEQKKALYFAPLSIFNPRVV